LVVSAGVDAVFKALLTALEPDAECDAEWALGVLNIMEKDRQ